MRTIEFVIEENLRKRSNSNGLIEISSEAPKPLNVDLMGVMNLLNQKQSKKTRRVQKQVQSNLDSFDHSPKQKIKKIQNVPKSEEKRFVSVRDQVMDFIFENVSYFSEDGSEYYVVDISKNKPVKVLHKKNEYEMIPGFVCNKCCDSFDTIESLITHSAEELAIPIHIHAQILKEFRKM